MSRRVLNDGRSCCADLYAGPAVAWLLGESFHPGGLGLTEHLGRLLNLAPSDLVLDVACGAGSSAVFLAKEFGCRAVGVDLADSLVFRARTTAGQEKLDGLLDFVPGDVEALPFQDACFDAVVSECAISTFLDKGSAARETARVLKPGGRLGFTDMLLTHGEVPTELRGWLFRAACIGDVWSSEKYREVFMSAGFSGWREERVAGVLEALLRDVQARLLALEVAERLEKLDLSGFDLSAVKEALKKIEPWINSGDVSYGIFLAVKEARHG